jgi:hypothetical protein
MSYFDSYRNRLLSQGNSGKEAVENATINLVNKNFSLSFGYKVVKVNQIDTDVIYSNGKEHVDGELLFKPQYIPVRGSIVEMDDAEYLIVDSLKHEIYPTAEIKLCNSNFPLPGQQVCTTYINDFGEEQEDCVDSAPVEIPCIVETSFYKQGEDQPINLPNDTVRITIPYTEHNSLKVNYSFKLYGESYQVSSFDYTQSLNKIGLLIINAKRV